MVCRNLGFAVEDGFVTTVWRPVPSGLRQITPEATPEVTPDVVRMLSAIRGEMSRRQIQAELELTDEKYFRLAGGTRIAIMKSRWKTQ